jgi:hypothetical protein
MRFNITLIDPPGYRFTHFLFDVVRMLQGGLDDLGFDCSVTRNDVERGCVNILVGIHNVTDTSWVASLIASKQPYVVLQTEMVKGKTINEVADPRFANIFLPLVRSAAAVWDSSDENITALAALDVRAEKLGWGYASAVREIHHRRERDIDFFFYGSVTPRRAVLLNKLSALGYKTVTVFDADAFYRRDLMARSEIILTIRQSDSMAHLPWGRILYCATNRCLVAGEGGLEQGPLEDIFSWAPPDEDVLEHLRETRARSDRRALADSFHDRLATRPMSGFLEPLMTTLTRVNP